MCILSLLFPLVCLLVKKLQVTFKLDSNDNLIPLATRKFVIVS